MSSGGMLPRRIARDPWHGHLQKVWPSNARWLEKLGFPVVVRHGQHYAEPHLARVARGVFNPWRWMSAEQRKRTLELLAATPEAEREEVIGALECTYTLGGPGRMLDALRRMRREVRIVRRAPKGNALEDTGDAEATEPVGGEPPP